MITTVCEKGGVIGVNAFSGALAPVWITGRQPTLDDYLDQFDYLINLVGIDHVAIGADSAEGIAIDNHFIWNQNKDKTMFKDYEAWLSTDKWHPKDFIGDSELINVTHGLLNRGYSKEDLVKILGQNWLRVFKQVWKK
jgi:membrane dipeptidase